MGIKIVLQGCVHKLVSYQSVAAGVGIILGALPIRDTGSDLYVVIVMTLTIIYYTAKE